MATNLGTQNGLTFNTGNMKPESGDQIDALWGQNMADNAAFLRWNESWAARKLFDFGICTMVVQDDLGSPLAYGTLKGTQRFVCYGTDAAGTIAGTVRVSVTKETANLAASRGTFYINGNVVDTFSPVDGAYEQAYTYVMNSDYTIGNLYNASFHWGVQTPNIYGADIFLESCYGILFPTAESVK